MPGAEKVAQMPLPLSVAVPTARDTDPWAAAMQRPTRDCSWLSGWLLSGWLLVALCFSAGCAMNRAATNTAPLPFAPNPSLDQVIATVNAHSARVQQLHAKNVRLTMPRQIGGLSATLDFDGRDRFRLSGETRMTGPELDLGSNDEVFWFWVKQDPPTVFYGRHDQFYYSAAQQFLPLPPNWIIETLGVVQLDPAGANQAFQSRRSSELLEIHNRIPTPRGELVRVLEVDPHGWIVRQTMYNSSGQPQASAVASDFRYDALHNVSLPHRVQIELPPIGLSFNLDIPTYIMNEPPTDPYTLWAMPKLDGHRYRDLGNPADMQGVSLLGGPNTLGRPASSYGAERPSSAAEAAPRETPRTAWSRLFPVKGLR